MVHTQWCNEDQCFTGISQLNWYHHKSLLHKCKKKIGIEKRFWWEIAALRGSSSHTSEELAATVLLVGYFFGRLEGVNRLCSELCGFHLPCKQRAHDHKKGREESQQSHRLWQIPICEKMFEQRLAEGGKEESKEMRDILFSTPLLWYDLGQAAVLYLQPYKTGITEIIRLQGTTCFGKGCIKNRKFGAKSKHAYRSPTKRD